MDNKKKVWQRNDPKTREQIENLKFGDTLILDIEGLHGFNYSRRSVQKVKMEDVSELNQSENPSLSENELCPLCRKPTLYLGDFDTSGKSRYDCFYVCLDCQLKIETYEDSSGPWD